MESKNIIIELANDTIFIDKNSIKVLQKKYADKSYSYSLNYTQKHLSAEELNSYINNSNAKIIYLNDLSFRAAVNIAKRYNYIPFEYLKYFIDKKGLIELIKESNTSSGYFFMLFISDKINQQDDAIKTDCGYCKQVMPKILEVYEKINNSDVEKCKQRCFMLDYRELQDAGYIYIDLSKTKFFKQVSANIDGDIVTNSVRITNINDFGFPTGWVVDKGSALRLGSLNTNAEVDDLFNDIVNLFE